MKHALYILLIVLAACGKPEKIEALKTAPQAAYQLCKAPVLPKGVAIQMSLDSSHSDQLTLRMSISNTDTEPLTIDAGTLALLSQDQRRHQPLSSEPSLISLAPDEEKQLEWQFQPINDLYLYQHSGLYGAWQQRYQLPLSFITGLSDTVAFCFPEEAYLQYSKKQAQLKPLLFRPAATALTPQAAARQEAYYAGIIHAATAVENINALQSPSTHFTDQEFFSAGLNVRHALYQQGDSLFLKLHMVNHAPHVLALYPDEISLSGNSHAQQLLRTAGLAPAESRPGAPTLLRKGDRISLLLVYKAPPSTDSLLLSLQGIKLAEAQKPLFRDSISFIRQ